MQTPNCTLVELKSYLESRVRRGLRLSKLYLSGIEIKATINLARKTIILQIVP